MIPSRGTNRGPLVAAATLLGTGLGGFADGILFHQILQLHGMLSAVLPRTSLLNVEVNMFWDGLFHAATWAMTVTGVALLWRAAGQRDVPHSTQILVGGMILGWGLFNFVEGSIDHGVLGIHHVVESGNHALWDTAFLGSGLVMIAIGMRLVRGEIRDEVRAGPVAVAPR